MEADFLDKYEKLMHQEDLFMIHKEDLLNLVDEENVRTQKSYQSLLKLGGIEGLFTRLNVNPVTGLCDDEEGEAFESRKKTFGKNDPVYPRAKTFLNCLMNPFKDKIILFLLITATVRLVIDLVEARNKWFDYCSIYIVVFVLSSISAITDYSKEKVFANFQVEIDYKETRVLRNGVEKLIPKSELVVGDILIVSAGDILPIDGIVIKAFSVSLEKEKSVEKFNNIHFKTSSLELKNTCEKFPIVLSGTKIVRGYASILVLCVGKDTFLNKKKISHYRKLRTRLNDTLDVKKYASENLSQPANGSEALFIRSRHSTRINSIKKNNSQENPINAFNPMDLKEGTSDSNKAIISLPSSGNKLKKTLSLEKETNHANEVNGNPNNFNNTRPKRLSSFKIHDENFHEAGKEIQNSNEENIQQQYKTISKKRIHSDSNLSRDSLGEENLYVKENELTPLQIKLYEISNTMAKYGIGAAFLICGFIIFTFLWDPSRFSNDDLIGVVFDSIVYGLVIVIFTVPESLPLVVTLTLAFSLYKMREQKTMIKNMEACENMACVDSILTDFTGILTKNEMKVTSILIEDDYISQNNVTRLRDYVSQDLFDFFCEGISINTIAFSAETDRFEKVYLGDPIECCLIRFLKHIDVGYSLLRNNLLRPIIDSSPYSSDSKVSFTIIEMDEKRDYVRIYVKGQAMTLLDSISIYIGKDQAVRSISVQQNEKIKKHSEKIMKEGGIPLLFCYRDMNKEQYNQTRHAYLNRDTEFKSIILRSLTFICLVGIQDELRDDVEKDIKDCQTAGIVVRMVTSQGKESARIAAEKCGIIKSNNQASTNSPSKIIPRTESNSNIKSKLINGSPEEILDAPEDLRKYIEQINFLRKSYTTFCRSNFQFLIWINLITYWKMRL